MNSTIAQLKEYRVTRRFVVGIVALGVFVSVAVNQLDAHHPIDKGIAGWPPLGLLLALEVLARAPWGAGRLKTAARVLATIAVAAGAGWLSYWHMVPAVEAHGESTAHSGAYIWPATVDGLMVIAAVAMVELGTRIRTLKSQMQRIDDATATASNLIEAVNSAVPAATVQEMTAQQGVADMKASDYWGARLGKRGTNSTKA